MYRTKHRIPALAAVAAAFLLVAPSAVAADIPWTMTGYVEPDAASTADSAVFQDLFHSVWSFAESNWITLKEAFATILYMR